MPRRPAPRQVVNELDSVISLVRRANLLAKATQAQAWAIIGTSLAYLTFSWWSSRHNGNLFLTRAEACSLGYVLTVAIYTLIARSALVMNRRLAMAKLLFVSQRISESEYMKMRAKILKEEGLL